MTNVNDFLQIVSHFTTFSNQLCANNGILSTALIVLGFLCVDIFPSNFAEWEPMEAISGTFEAYHVELGSLIFAGCPAAQLLARNIFFYEDTYVVPTTANGTGKLVPKPTPTLTSNEWPIPDNASVAMACLQIESKVQNAMKCTYGSHKATITCFIPLHLFVYLFRTSDTHRTPTLWIAKGERALTCFLSPAWDKKVVQHNGDTIRCGVIVEKVVMRYHIAKQQLSIVFPYRRWKLTNGEWEALDSDTTSTEQVVLHISMQGGDVEDVAVNDDWSLANLRNYLVLRFSLSGDFSLVINGRVVRKRQEGSFLCKEIAFPGCVSIKQPLDM